MTGAWNVERGVTDGAARSQAYMVEGPRLRGDGVALPDQRRVVTFRSPATLRRLIGVPAVALAVVVGVLAGPLAASASAAATLDQSQTDTSSLGLLVRSVFPKAQTFTARRSGPLPQVDLALQSESESIPQMPVTVQIRDTSDGAPSSTVLATTIVPASDLKPSPDFGWVSAHFADPATVQAGTQYAIVAFTSDGGAWWLGIASTNAYPDGEAFATFDRGGTWHGQPLDLAFKTYVDSAVYDFGAGFLAPLDDDAVNVLKAGQGVPVKFSLGGDQGLDILAEGSPSSRPVACDADAVLDPVEETVTAGASSLTYDATTGVYTYTWKTDKAWAGTCRELTVTLSDGTTHTAQFKLTR